MTTVSLLQCQVSFQYRVTDHFCSITVVVTTVVSQVRSSSVPLEKWPPARNRRSVFRTNPFQQIWEWLFSPSASLSWEWDAVVSSSSSFGRCGMQRSPMPSHKSPLSPLGQLSLLSSGGWLRFLLSVRVARGKWLRRTERGEVVSLQWRHLYTTTAEEEEESQTTLSKENI